MSSRARLSLFTLVTLSPLALLAVAGWQGGAWVWLAAVALSGLVVVLDLIVPPLLEDAPEGAEFPGSDRLLAVLGLAALALMPLTVAACLSGRLGWWEAAALVLAAGWWLGQVGHPTAHELIHRADRRLFRLGQAVYTALLMGHHASSHRLVHHVHAGSRFDPATARAGEGFWRFLLRAGFGGFRAGWQAETRLRAGRGGLHPYAFYIGGAGVSLALAALIGGWAGIGLWIVLGLHAQIQVHLSDYVQHYGLSRATLPDGRLEPVSARHSWNAGHWLSSHLMLNAPRHSDHHAHPSRPYPALRLPDADTAPRLPWPLPMACMLALFPPVWRRLMAPHVARWQGHAFA